MATQLIVEWTRTVLRVAVAERQAGISRLAAIHSQPISSMGELPQRLRQLVKTLKPTSTDTIAVIPREQVITRVMKFPGTQPSELAQMAELYARAQLPYPREQAVMDFSVLQQEGGFSTVAIIACQRDIIDRAIAVLQEAGLTASLLTVSSWGVLGWYQQAGSTGGAKEPVLILNIDDTRTDLVLVSGGRILSSRSVGQGVKDWDASADTMELLAQEVERSRAAIRKEIATAEVHSLVVTGAGITGESGERLSQRIGLPVFVVEGRRAFPERSVHGADGGSLVVVGGAASSPPRGLLNLSPPELRNRLHHREQVRDLVRVSALLVGVLAASSGLLGLQVVRRQKMAAQLDQVLADLAPTAKQAQEQARTAQLVQTVTANRRQLAKTFAAVFHATPPDISLDVLTFERPRREVVVRGRAGSTQDVITYIAQLEAMEGVERVDLKYSTRRSTPMGERTDFELVLRL